MAKETDEERKAREERERKLREELEKEAGKVEPKNALPQIRARINAKKEKTKKLGGKKAGGRGRG